MPVPTNIGTPKATDIRQNLSNDVVRAIDRDASLKAEILVDDVKGYINTGFPVNAAIGFIFRRFDEDFQGIEPFLDDGSMVDSVNHVKWTSQPELAAFLTRLSDRMIYDDTIQAAKPVRSLSELRRTCELTKDDRLDLYKFFFKGQAKLQKQIEDADDDDHSVIYNDDPYIYIPSHFGLLDFYQSFPPEMSYRTSRCFHRPESLAEELDVHSQGYNRISAGDSQQLANIYSSFAEVITRLHD